jgi:hypothetical protein
VLHIPQLCVVQTSYEEATMSESHLPSDLSKFRRPEDIPTEMLSNFKTRLCPFTIAEEPCPYGEACSFAHSQAEKRESPFFRTQLCRRGLACPYKETCRFAHTPEETRPMPEREVRCARTKSRRVLIDGEKMPSIRLPAHIYERERERERAAMMKKMRSMPSARVSNPVASSSPTTSRIYTRSTSNHPTRATRGR